MCLIDSIFNKGGGEAPVKSGKQDVRKRFGERGDCSSCCGNWED